MVSYGIFLTSVCQAGIESSANDEANSMEQIEHFPYNYTYL